jgi:hypothetical protein
LHRLQNDYNEGVTQGKSVDPLIERCLKALNISHLSEWDVLMFLNRHATSLASVAHISDLLGYEKVVIAKALTKLESDGLVRRSRASNGVRYYEPTVNLDPDRESCFHQVIDPAKIRSTRLVLAKKLRPR